MAWEEAGTLEPEVSTLSVKSRDPLETPRDWEESESGALGKTEEPVSAETLWSHEGSDTLQPRPLGSEGAEEDAKPLLGPPGLRPTESCSPSLIPEDASGPQPLAEGNQEASWGLEGRAEVLGKADGEQEDLGSGGIPEGLQEEGEESREESEADELGETLPDSTPLGLYLRSPASPKWDLPGEQRPSPQGEPGGERTRDCSPGHAGKEGPHLLGKEFGCRFLQSAKGYSSENSLSGKGEHFMDSQAVF